MGNCLSSRAFKQANDMIRFTIKKNKSKSSLRVSAQEGKIGFAVRRDTKNPRDWNLYSSDKEK